MRFLTFLFTAIIAFQCQSAVAQNYMRIAFWNVENLFDTQDDSTRNDDSFTPNGENHWSTKRYQTKLRNLYKTITAMCGNGEEFNPPIIIGLAEVENDKVLRDLCQSTPLRKMGYSFVHFDSPDLRGIDNALLYRKELFTPIHAEAISLSDSNKAFFTRDILLVQGVTTLGDTLIMLINHFPSKRGGANADKHRKEAANKLREIMDSIGAAHASSAIIVTGDFNASPNEPEVVPILVSTHPKGAAYINLMSCIESGRGSHKYQDNWSCIDQIIVSSNLTDGSLGIHTVTPCAQIFDAEFLLVDDEKYLGKKPFRTYLGPRYIGGYSDHLPIYIDIVRQPK